VLLAAASRLIPHPDNVTPLAAMALFGGAHLSNRAAAVAVPLTALLLSDLVLGFHSTMPFVYGSFIVIVLIGARLGRRKAVLPVAIAALASSVLFFLVTNFGVWAMGTMYPETWAGLTAAYVAAVPFFRNTVVGDLAYVAMLFGGFAYLERQFPALRADH
jgi:hypothetical protein